MLKKCPSTDLNQGLDQSEERHFEPSQHELKARGASLTPNWEMLANQAMTASEEGMQGSRCFNSPQVHVEEVVRSPLQNHDRVSSRGRYCLKITFYEATKRGH